MWSADATVDAGCWRCKLEPTPPQQTLAPRKNDEQLKAEMGIEVVRQRRLAPATRWRRERRDISIDKRDAETAAEADFLRNLFRSERVPPGREGEGEVGKRSVPVLVLRSKLGPVNAIRQTAHSLSLSSCEL